MISGSLMPLETPQNSPLTSQERSLLYLTARGDTLNAVAVSLGTSVTDVQAMLDTIQARLGLPSRGALIVHAVVQGWV